MRWWLEKDEEWDFSKIIEYIKDYDTVFIGCDSKYHSSGTKFAIAVAIYRNPCVTYWYTKEKTAKIPRDIRYRLWMEVEKAMDIAWQIREKLPNINIEVHCDINSDDKFPSSVLNQQARGYIAGSGFVYKNKPNAWCATGCADYHTR